MRMTKIFQSGNSQALRIPKEFQFDCDEVQIFERNGELIVRKPPNNLARAFKLFSQLSEDLPEDFERSDLPPQVREDF